MTQENDSDSVIKMAEQIFAEARRFEVRVPLGVAFDIGSVMAIASNDTYKWDDPEYQILQNLDKIVPRELIRNGKEGYQGNIDQEVVIPLSFKEVKLMGLAILATKDEKQNRRLKKSANLGDYTEFRMKGLKAFLQIQEAFKTSGGKLDEDLNTKLREKFEIT